MKKILVLLIAVAFSNTINAQCGNYNVFVTGSNVYMITDKVGGFDLGGATLLLNYTGTPPADFAPIAAPAAAATHTPYVQTSNVPAGVLAINFGASSGTPIRINTTQTLIAIIPGTFSALSFIPNDPNNIVVDAAVCIYNYANIVLPVELLSFKGIKKGKTSQLQWETSNEKNLVNYIIERSPDGRNFHPVGFTKPRSTSANEKVAYDFVDDQPEMGINYYRLLSKGVGKDEKYSKVISLDFGLGLSGRVYPNPLDGELSIDLDIESNTGEVEVGIYDVVGKQVLSKKFQNNDRRVNMTLPTSDLAPGSYFVKVKVGSYNWERQITKM